MQTQKHMILPHSPTCTQKHWSSLRCV